VQFHLAQGVILMRIEPGREQNELRVESVQRRKTQARPRGTELFTACAGRKWQVENIAAADLIGIA
jgi:hypothetical protein